MSTTKEKIPTFILDLSSSAANPVKLKFDSLQATVGSLLFVYKVPHPVKTGATITIDTANNLKGKSITFSGAANNPDASKIHLRFTFWEENGNELIHNFPPGQDVIKDEEVNYKFCVKFI